MQHELRELLERKVAMGPGHGSGYYFDMNDDDIDYDLQAGELMAGGKRRKRAKKMTPMQRKMAHVRSYKGKGGDYIDLNNYSYYQGGVQKAKGRRRRAAAPRSGYARNPIEKAERELYKQEKNENWIMTQGPAYAAKLRKKADMITQALADTRMGVVGELYDQRYKNNLVNLSGYAPYMNASKKLGYKVSALPAPPAAPNAYRIALANARRRVRNQAAVENAQQYNDAYPNYDQLA